MATKSIPINSSFRGAKPGLWYSWLCALTCALSLTLSATVHAEPGEQDAVLAVTRLDFTASDEASEPYAMQIYVYDGGLRIEIGQGNTDYVYFDRAQKRIYSVDVEAQTATVYPADGAPDELALGAYTEGLEVESMAQDQQALPKVDDFSTAALTLTAKGVPCATAIIAPDLLREASAVMAEYLRILSISARQRMTLRPRESVEDCEIAVDVVKPDWPMRAGFPVVLENFRGERRFLENYTADVPASRDMFAVPEGFAVVMAEVDRPAVTVEPEVAEPEAAEPEAAEPEAAEPEAAEPEAAEPEAAEPEAAEPEAAEPEAAEPEAAEPEVAEPEVAEPEAAEPESVEPESVEPESVEPESVEPELVEPETVRPESVDSDTVKPETVEPETVEPETVEPETVEPETVEPETVEPETVEPESIEPESIEPESIEPESIEPESIEPESIEPESIEPESIEPETATAE